MVSVEHPMEFPIRNRALIIVLIVLGEKLRERLKSSQPVTVTNKSLLESNNTISLDWVVRAVPRILMPMVNKGK